MMNLTEAREKLRAAISRLEDSARRDPIRSDPASRHAVASVVQDGRELLDAIEPGYNNYGAVVTEAGCVEALTTITSHLSGFADHLADHLAQHRASDTSTAPVSDTTLLTAAEFDALLDGMTREEFSKFNRLGVALHLALKAGNPQSEKEVEQIGLAVLMASRNDPDAPAATLAEDAVLIWRATP